jgi:restriction system protein
LELIQKGDLEKIKAYVLETHPEETRAGNAARQLYRFVKEMKTGDVVLIPSESSAYITFGELLEDTIYLEPKENLKELGLGKCPFIKRRRVKWLTTKTRNNLDPYLYKLLNSHYGLTGAKQYEHFIDRSLYSFFVKNNTAHLIFEVTKEERIRLTDLINFFQSNLACIDLYNELTGLEYQKDDVDIKINVQSPGPIEFSGLVPLILAIAFLGVVLVGGKVKFILTKDKQEGELSTEGLIEKINQFITQRNKDKTSAMRLEAKLKSAHANLNIKSPEIILIQKDETDKKDETATKEP